MSTEAIQSRQAQLASLIDTAAKELRSAPTMALPERDAPIVALSVERIQGQYDVTRAKRDTDHAVDLLYIAYNTTPQKHGGIRVQISALMNALIRAQQDSGPASAPANLQVPDCPVCRAPMVLRQARRVA